MEYVTVDERTLPGWDANCAIIFGVGVAPIPAPALLRDTVSVRSMREDRVLYS